MINCDCQRLNDEGGNAPDMISTITSSTISTVTSAAFAGSLALIGIWVLLALLVQKELVSAMVGKRAERLSQALNIAIAPLLIVFVMTVITKVVEVLQ